jgi:hypothetical protein
MSDGEKKMTPRRIPAPSGYRCRHVRAWVRVCGLPGCHKALG